MTLQELVDFLGDCDPASVVPIGFAQPHSYRGNYHDLAFEMRRNVTVGAMLACATEAIGQTYEGWKGGDYTMDADLADVYLVQSEGQTGEAMGPVLLAYMTGRLDLLDDWGIPDAATSDSG